MQGAENSLVGGGVLLHVLGEELVGDFPAKREVIREENLAYSARPIFSRIL